MEEIAPGLWYWPAYREAISKDVSSYYLERERVLVDPMLPPEGLAWFEEHGAPEHLLLSCRHHDRDAWAIREAFGSTVWVVESGAHELEGRGPFETFAWGDELPGVVVAVEVDAISPDETAFHIRAHDALVIADGAVRWDGVPGITFVPDFLMDDPEHTKAGLRAAFMRLLDLDWHLLLLAHGAPVLEHAKDELRALAER